MKAEWEGDEPDSRCGQPAAAQVAYDYTMLRHAVEFAQHFQRASVLEMVEELRAENDVHGVAGEWQCQRVGSRRRQRRARCLAGERLGRIHPGTSLLTHELVGKMSLGINPDEQPRWG